MNDGLEPEWLDSLPASDPKADRSRRDLRLLNVLMGNAGHLAAAARRALGGRAILMRANRFLHHFNRTSLRRLLELASRRTDFFIACEPRRERLALGAS